MRSRGLVGTFTAVVAWFRARPRLLHTIEVILLALTLALCAWAVAGEWSKAEPLLEHAKPGYLGLAIASVAAYYLVFILGWIRMLAAWSIRSRTGRPSRRRWSRCSRSTSPAGSGRRRRARSRCGGPPA